MLKSNKEITRESYQAIAQEFAQNVADLAPIKSIEKFMTLLGPKAKVIDIGSGSGRDAKIFTSKGIDVLGVDFSSNLIDIAKLNTPLANFQLLDIETLNLPASFFDGAWAAMSLAHIAKENFPSVLNRIYCLLKKNGYFYLTLKKGSNEGLEKDLRYNDNVVKFWSYFSEEELKNFLETADFKILEFSLVKKNHSYQTHDAFRVFCQRVD